LRGCYEDIAIGVDPATGHELMVLLSGLRPSSETREIVKTQDFLYELWTLTQKRGDLRGRKNAIGKHGNPLCTRTHRIPPVPKEPLSHWRLRKSSGTIGI
jgi:hypothetical protein